MSQPDQHSMTNHRSSRAALVVAAVLLSAAACGTKDAPDPIEPSGPVARVRFVNVITDTARGRVNASLEGQPLNINLTYTQSAPATLAAPSTAPYAAILAGERSLVLKRTADTSVVVATLPFTIAADEDRTVYAIGGVGGSAVTAFVTRDSNPVPAATQARVRVVHLSPTAGPVDVFLTAPAADLAAATPSAANILYRGVSAYLTVAPGTYRFRAVRAGTPAADRAANVVIDLVNVSTNPVTPLAFAGGRGRTIVTADNNVGGAPLRAFVLIDR